MYRLFLVRILMLKEKNVQKKVKIKGEYHDEKKEKKDV